MIMFGQTLVESAVAIASAEETIVFTDIPSYGVITMSLRINSPK